MIHPWIGVVPFFSFYGLFFRFERLNQWERSDTIWLLHVGDVRETTRTKRGADRRWKVKCRSEDRVLSMLLLIIVLISSGLLL
jgi:formate dehydrogenase subunit gamma